ncbi:ParB N-terminal domain-containing protein [Laceyella putida]|uniref:ParB N-terminal domain-containing protein n=1 Tax=Laceyella putida TaxID=110101 RepID=A0ABW2RLH0_9BACL
MDILSSLKLVDVERIRLHEPTESVRLGRTVQAIAKEGVLRNPLLAIRLENSDYLILDGAHRTGALKRLGCKRIPLQIVDPSQVDIGSWDHMIPAGTWLQGLSQHPSLLWTSVFSNDAALLAKVVDADGAPKFVYLNGEQTDPMERLKMWHHIVDAYNKDYPVRRFPKGSRLYPEPGMILLQYPTCTLEDLKDIVMTGHKVPAGVTRCMVEGRLLNLRIPIRLLESREVDLKEWNQLCEKWAEQLRFYSESIYLCEV